MILYISHHFFHYESGNLCRLFFPYEKLKVVYEEPKADETEIIVKACISENLYLTDIFRGGKTISIKEETDYLFNKEDSEYLIIKIIFLAFVEFTGYKPKWGLLTGIHPVKLFTKYACDIGESAALTLFLEKFFVSAEKLDLCKRIAKAQEPALSKLTENDFSLYISIPFCPSRCSYCSFVSQSVEKSKKLIVPYFNLLLEELEDTAEVVKESKLRLVTVYIGGGTPTTLSATQLRTLINTVKELFDMGNCCEFTVEAGRPDTIDKDKLDVFNECNITRISINPQTLDDEVLQIIGRKHTAEDVINTFILAREKGIDNINMDLIAGLQGDTLKTFMKTLDKVIELSPENVTVHSLSLKRSAEIFTHDDVESYHNNGEETRKMIDYSVKRLSEEGYEPYYLYRQSRMAGNLENTGWAKKDTICDYNIYTMDESQTVIACGAGGVSKIKDPYSETLERVFNFKYAYEYIDRFNEIKTRKREVTRYYEQFRKRIH